MHFWHMADILEVSSNTGSKSLSWQRLFPKLMLLFLVVYNFRQVFWKCQVCLLPLKNLGNPSLEQRLVSQRNPYRRVCCVADSKEFSALRENAFKLMHSEKNAFKKHKMSLN